MEPEQVQETRKTNGRLFGRDEILARAGILEQERIYVPEWDASVIVTELTAAERDEFEASVIRGRGKDMDVIMRGLRAKLVARAVVDETGNRLFNDTDWEDLAQVGAHAVDRIFSVAQRLSGLTKEDIDELAGKSVSGRPEESATPSL